MRLKNAIIFGAGATLVMLFLFSIGWPPGSTPKDIEFAVGETAIVTFVIDGDTIEIAGGARVRYIGIDTPEITHTPLETPDCFGPEATARNRELVLGKEVTLVADTTDKDRYGRLLRYVYVGDIFVNHVLVEEGFARAIFIKPDTHRYSLLRDAQDNARSRGRGLWGSCQ